MEDKEYEKALSQMRERKELKERSIELLREIDRRRKNGEAPHIDDSNQILLAVGFGLLYLAEIVSVCASDLQTVIEEKEV